MAENPDEKIYFPPIKERSRKAVFEDMIPWDGMPPLELPTLADLALDLPDLEPLALPDPKVFELWQAKRLRAAFWR